MIRYIPGPGASDSISRIQGHIRRGKTSLRLPADRRPQPIHAVEPKQGSEALAQPLPKLALSVITAHHEKLIGQLIIQFGIHPTRAYQLVLNNKEPVILQLEAWPFRNAKPRNRAGWMIQAIEGNYQAPPSYLDGKQKRKDQELLGAARAVKAACAICSGTGFRNIKTTQYPNGAIRECTHDSATELQIPSEFAG